MPLTAKLHWDLHETQWSVQFKPPYRRGDRVDAVLPSPTHWQFDERMIHDLGGCIAVQATLVRLELVRT